MTARCCRCWLAVAVGFLAVVAASDAGAQPDLVEGTCSNYRLSSTSAAVAASGGSGTFFIEWDWEEPPSDGMCIINCSYGDCGDSTGSVQSSASWLGSTRPFADRVDFFR